MIQATIQHKAVKTENIGKAIQVSKNCSEIVDAFNHDMHVPRMNTEEKVI